MNFTEKQRYNIDDLIEIMALLRGENGCPWDKEQDHHSIRKNLIEETYEVVEAIDNDDQLLLREELGDLLLQVVFHAQIEKEKDAFDFSDVANDICKKLIVRHPHIFSDISVQNTDEVLSNWEDIKKQTKGQTKCSETLDDVPKTLPSLMRASKVLQRASKGGYGIDSLEDAMADLTSRVKALESGLEHGKIANETPDLGGVLLSVVNISRIISLDSEKDLTFATEKFINRLRDNEDKAFLRGFKDEA